MAERRMFSKRIINTARFLKMPTSTQCLYFHLGLNADDDGVVEAYTIMNSIGATEDDLNILVQKNFVQILNHDLVAYIIDWRENNKIRADRKVDSIYKDLLLQLNPEIKLLESKDRADRKNKNEWDVRGTTMGRHSIGKDSIGKDSIKKYIICPGCNKTIDLNNFLEDKNKCKECYKIELFNIFWNEYPKKTAKKVALKSFLKIDIDDIKFSEILKALKVFKNSKEWKKENGKFIPYPASWLNQERWLDENIDHSSSNIVKEIKDKDLEDRFNKIKAKIGGDQNR